MKSFKQHTTKYELDREQLDEELNKKVKLDEATMGDLLIGLGAAGGLLAMKKAWDTFGKGTKLQRKLHALNPFQSKADKAQMAKDAEERRTKTVDNAKSILDDPKAKQKDKDEAQADLDKHATDDEKETYRQDRITKAKKTGDQATVDKLSTDDEKAKAKVDKDREDKEKKTTKADAAALDFPKDDQGRIKNQGDAEKYKEMAGKAPDGWVTSPEDSPSAGKVWKTADQTAWDQEKAAQDKAEKDAADKAAADKEAEAEKKRQEKEAEAEKVAAAKKKKRDQSRDATEKGLYGKAGTSKKSQRKAARKAMIKKATGSESFIPDCISILSDLTEDFTKEDRTQLLEELVLEETMTLQESEELQAIMALDDAKIKADINRKGQVVVKKRDLKKAEKILKKEFGGKFKTLMPKLVGEEVLEARTAYDIVSKARKRLIEVVDEHAVRELYLFIENERSLMKQRDSIIKNISRKMKSGKYDHKKAPKLWMYLVDQGAKMYDKLNSSPGVSSFDKDTKMSVAIQLADEMKAEIELGNYS